MSGNQQITAAHPYGRRAERAKRRVISGDFYAFRGVFRRDGADSGGRGAASRRTSRRFGASDRTT